jgi:UPF0716 protein FxsA
VGRLLLLFTLVPLVDLWVLVAIGRALGLWQTVALVVATGFAGAWLAKTEGRRVVLGWQRALREGRVPDEGILSGALVLAGGVLLVSPGVLTDVVGLALLFPPSRRLAAAGLRRYLARKVRSGQVRVVTFGGPPPPGGRASDDVVDVTPPLPRARPDA